MRIGINAQLLSLQSTYRAAGVSKYILRLLQGLSEVDTTNEYRVYLGPWARDPELRARLGLGDNFRVECSRLPTHSPAARIIWEQTAQAIRCRQLDVLHCPVNVAPLVTRVPTVVTIHDLSFMVFRDKHVPIKRRYLERMTKASARRARAIVTDSEHTRLEVIRMLRTPEDKVTAIPLAVESGFHWLGSSPATLSRIAAFREDKGLPERFFLYMGTLEPRKNIPVLLRAFAEYRRKSGSADPVRLVIAGPRGWLYDAIFAEVERLGLEEDVFFPGFVPQDEMIYLYNAALAFVYLSAYEGFGLPPLEAMACGVPVIVNNATSLPEVVGEAGVLVDADNVEQVACVMQRVAASREERDLLCAAGMRRASEYSWRKTAEATMDLYNRVAGAG